MNVSRYLLGQIFNQQILGNAILAVSAISEVKGWFEDESESDISLKKAFTGNTEA